MKTMSVPEKISKAKLVIILRDTIRLFEEEQYDKASLEKQIKFVFRNS